MATLSASSSTNTNEDNSPPPLPRPIFRRPSVANADKSSAAAAAIATDYKCPQRRTSLSSSTTTNQSLDALGQLCAQHIKSNPTETVKFIPNIGGISANNKGSILPHSELQLTPTNYKRALNIPKCIETLPGGEVPARRLSRHNSAGEVESSPQRKPLLRKVPSRRLSRHNSAGNKGSSMRSMGGNSMRSLGGSLKNVMEDEVETSYDLGSSFTELGSSFTDVTSKKSHEDIAREKNYVPTRRGNLSRTNSGGRAAAGGLSRTNSGKRGRVTPVENCTNSSSFRGILETAEYVEGPAERRRSFPPNSERSGSFRRDISLKSLRMYCSTSSLSSCGSSLHYNGSSSKQLGSGSGGRQSDDSSIRSHNVSSMFGSDMDMLGLSWADASSSRSSYQIGESQHGGQSSQISQITGIHESISSSISSSGLYRPTTQPSSLNYKPIRSSASKSKKLFKQMRRLSSGLTGAITRRSSVEKEERITWNPGYGDVVAAASRTLKRSSTAPLENEQTAAARTTLIDKNINKLRRSDVSVIDGAATIDEESQKNNKELDDDPEYSIAPPTKPSSRKNILNRLSKSLSSSLRRSSNCTDADVPKQSPRLFRHSTGNADAIEIGYDNEA